MTRVTITWSRDVLRRIVSGEAKPDLMSLVGNVPTLLLVSGNRAYSICLEVNESHLETLRRACSHSCTISNVTELA